MDNEEAIKLMRSIRRTPANWILEYEAIDKAIEALEGHQPVVDGWIPASEPPETTRHCIVADGSLISHYAYYIAPKKTFYRIGNGSQITGGDLLDEDIIEPAYWREMPDVPEDSIMDQCCG